MKASVYGGYFTLIHGFFSPHPGVAGSTSMFKKIQKKRSDGWGINHGSRAINASLLFASLSFLRQGFLIMMRNCRYL